jgi:hypothetical protein
MIATFPGVAALRHWPIVYLIRNIGCDRNEIDLGTRLAKLGMGPRHLLVLRDVATRIR